MGQRFWLLSYILSYFKQNKWTGKSVEKVKDGSERIPAQRKLHIYASIQFLKISISIYKLVVSLPPPPLKTDKVGDEA